MSDVVHACHAAIGRQTPTNEEWYYAPPGSDCSIPWHVLILYRISVQAGFEHATRIYINSYPADELRSDVLGKLAGLRKQALIAPEITIGN